MSSVQNKRCSLQMFLYAQEVAIHCLYVLLARWGPYLPPLHGVFPSDFEQVVSRSPGPLWVHCQQLLRPDPLFLNNSKSLALSSAGESIEPSIESLVCASWGLSHPTRLKQRKEGAPGWLQLAAGVLNILPWTPDLGFFVFFCSLLRLHPD